MNYFEEPEMKENSCQYCGFECHGTYCSVDCKKADLYDNCRD